MSAILKEDPPELSETNHNIFTFQQFRNDVRRTFVSVDMMDNQNVGMVKRASSTGFAQSGAIARTSGQSLFWRRIRRHDFMKRSRSGSWKTTSQR
jgi:hypothetical protein